MKKSGKKYAEILSEQIEAIRKKYEAYIKVEEALETVDGRYDEYIDGMFVYNTDTSEPIRSGAEVSVKTLVTMLNFLRPSTVNPVEVSITGEKFLLPVRYELVNDINKRLVSVTWNYKNRFKFNCKVDVQELISSIPLLADLIKPKFRNVYDTEHAHFIGQSVSEIRAIKVPSFEFDQSFMTAHSTVEYFKFKSRVVNWYGGNKTLLDHSIANLVSAEIVKYAIKIIG